jgi:hypothetical protein
MTAPASHGYPDFGRYQAQADIKLLDQNAIVISADTNVNVGFVGNVPYLGVTFIATVQSIRAIFAFYADSTFTTATQNVAVDIQQGATFTDSIPVLGPFLQVQLQAGAYNATYSLKLYQTATGVKAQSGFYGRPILVNEAQASHAAGTTFITPGPCIVGEHHFRWRCAAAADVIQVETIDHGGTVKPLVRVTGADPIQSVLFFAPACSLRVRVTNSGAGAANYDVMLAARPWGPGW